MADARDYGQAERRVVQSSIHLPAARHVNALAGSQGGPVSEVKSHTPPRHTLVAPQGDQLCLRGFEAGVWRLREVAWDLELDVYKTTRVLLRCNMIHDCTQGLSDNEEIQSVFHSSKYHRKKKLRSNCFEGTF